MEATLEDLSIRSNSRQFAARLNSFKARPELFKWRVGPGSVPDLIRRAGSVPGLNTIQLNFPEHVVGEGVANLATAANDTGLSISGINLRFEPEAFPTGALSSPDPAKRQAAIDLTYEAMDVASHLGAIQVGLWLSEDGFDYPFQADYAKSWDALRTSVATLSTRAENLLISIEPKPADRRRYCLVPDVATALLLIEEIGAANLGVRIDFSHSLMCGENPATMAVHCLQKKRLFGLDLNDSYSRQDDGMRVATVHIPQTLELLWYLDRYGYVGVYYFDTFALRVDPVREYTENIARTEQLIHVARQLDVDALHRTFEVGDDESQSTWWHRLVRNTQ